MKFIYEYIPEMINYRIDLGYSLQPTSWYLKDFSRYLKKNFPSETMLTQEMIMPWCVQRKTEQACSFRSRMSSIRQFTLYLFANGASNFVLDLNFLPKITRYVPYIFTNMELKTIFEMADSKKYIKPITAKNRIISVIYRLIYFCGLRPNEGREIMKKDLDLDNGTILIRKNKNHKERLIPMAADVTDMMREYIDEMKLIFPNTDYVFPSPTGLPYHSKWLRTEFLKIWDEIKPEGGRARVRVYDLRHRWATTVMMKLLNDGEDLYSLLPYMSAYMGHSNFEDTAYYIHLLPEELIKSSEVDWERFSSIIPEVSKYD